MKRTVEPELMEGAEQSLAYAQADFEQPHNYFIELFKEKFPENIIGNVLDLGCGTGDITLRFAKVYADCNIDGIDGSQEMLFYAQKDLVSSDKNIQNRVNFVEGTLPEVTLPLPNYEVIISNSLLHHLHQPLILWQTVKKYSKNKTKIFIMDLFRPHNREEAQKLVNTYAGNEPQILQQDFFNSLCAAFTLDEVKQQLQTENLDYLSLEQISDRHFIIYGEYDY